MRFAKLAQLSSSTKPSILFQQKSVLKHTMNLPLLEDLLQKSWNQKQFNQILSQMILSGFFQDTFAASRLLKFSSDFSFLPIQQSLVIFNHIESPNGFIWNTMMRAYVKRNSPREAVNLYKLMLYCDADTDNYTFPILIHATALRFSTFEGKQVHDHVLKLGYDADVYVQNTLINMYAVCGNMVNARKIFDESSVLDLVSWNSVLAGYVRMEDVEEAAYIYGRMPERSIIASNSMIMLFGKRGAVSEACKLFNEMPEKDLVSWSALISCYEQNEMYKDALLVFVKMNEYGLKVDEVVVVSVLSVCAHLSAAWAGESIHGLGVKIGIESYVNLQNALIHMYSSCGEITYAERFFVLGSFLDQISWNSMISGYMRCGSVNKARELFDRMPHRDVVSWSAMISGFAQHDKFFETLKVFNEMQFSGVTPDETTLVSVISACAGLAATKQGKQIHAYIRKRGFKINVILGTTLISMYMKCGLPENALEIFRGMEGKGVSTWNALVLGLATNGLVDQSLEMFSEMKKSGMAPNEITFMGVLGACRHMGLVDEGRKQFSSMVEDHGIEPNVKHYGCMVDLLGRAGLLKEAEELIESMPTAPDVPTWGALLAACKMHGDHEMGEKVGRKLVKIQPYHDGFHVLLSNIYASKGDWDDMLEIRGVMTQNGVTKIPGCSML